MLKYDINSLCLTFYATPLFLCFFSKKLTISFPLMFFPKPQLSTLFSSVCLFYTFSLRRKVPPQISPFSSGNQAVHLGQYITYQCTITEGDLPLNIRWTFNNQPLVNDDDRDILVSKLGRRSSVLTIENVSARHAGNYSCHGSNEAGKTSYGAQLKVIGYLMNKTL